MTKLLVVQTLNMSLESSKLLVQASQTLNVQANSKKWVSITKQSFEAPVDTSLTFVSKGSVDSLSFLFSSLHLNFLSVFFYIRKKTVKKGINIKLPAQQRKFNRSSNVETSTQRGKKCLDLIFAIYFFLLTLNDKRDSIIFSNNPISQD